ncbi:hypothetical protein E2C01_027379 [Portunus trituberculatus]|uniref:Uncharacterized protein n=1 Tax=Portunus trituberculatus TaxID=210409 RepID=A0A5B7EL68_PORTR|nr:hypothetical protein [Portunus trituberculatus]
MKESYSDRPNNSVMAERQQHHNTMTVLARPGKLLTIGRILTLAGVADNYGLGERLGVLVVKAAGCEMQSSVFPACEHDPRSKPPGGTRSGCDQPHPPLGDNVGCKHGSSLTPDLIPCKMMWAVTGEVDLTTGITRLRGAVGEVALGYSWSIHREGLLWLCFAIHPPAPATATWPLRHSPPPSSKLFPTT